MAKKLWNKDIKAMIEALESDIEFQYECIKTVEHRIKNRERLKENNPDRDDERVNAMERKRIEDKHERIRKLTEVIETLKTL